MIPRVMDPATGEWAADCSADLVAVRSTWVAGIVAMVARMWRNSVEWTAGGVFGMAHRAAAAATVTANIPAATSRFPAMPNIMVYLAESFL